MIRAGALTAVAIAALACKSAPSGFSGGADDRWTMPLVGALEDGLLVTPVTVGTSGPYLFAIDPDAPITAVDAELVKEARPRVIAGPPRLDQNNETQTRIYVELQSLEIGSLIVERRKAIVVNKNVFDTAGRRIHGVLGRDVLDEQLVFGVDRDRGMMTLIDGARWTPPAGAIAIPYTQVIKPGTDVVPLRVVHAKIGDDELDLHVDLGATASQLRDTAWEHAKLVAREVSGLVVDEVGIFRKFDKASEPTAVSVGAATAPRVAFIPYGDQRWAEHEVAGSLGLGFFAPYDVWLDRGHKTIYLTPRQPQPLAERLGRWDTGALGKCATPGCVVVRMIDPLGGKPPPEDRPRPAPILSLTREERAGGMPLELVLEAKDHPELPLVIVNMPPNIDRMIDQLPVEFATAQLVTVDASPYPRTCPGTNGCVDKLAR